MATIITREVGGTAKNSPLTNAELDNNFINLNDAIANLPTPALASTTSAGLMSASDKTKLDGVEAGAQVNTVNSVAGKTGVVTLVTADVTDLPGALDARPYVETAANVITANTTAVAGRSYDCDTSAGAFTLTLPVTPVIGTRIGVRDFKRSFATYNLTIGRNAQVIEGLAENCLINKLFRGSLEFRGGTQGWVFI